MSTTLTPSGASTEKPDSNMFRPPARLGTAAGDVENQRAIAETQGAIVVAKRFPRDQVQALDRILQAFTRPTLAEKALYSYARGGTEVTGPSIRAAEAIAQSWGNFQHGVRELEQRPGESTVEAFAWDVETNTRSSKTFQVSHVRHTRAGQKMLDDPRDIYELVANQGARRLRACILAVIPSDVIEAAMDQAELTLRTKIQITPELIQSLLDKFASIGVNKAAIEARIQRRLDAITPALVVNLGKIYNSVNDGMSAATDWFDAAPSSQATGQVADAGKTRTEQLKEKLKKDAGAAGKTDAGADVPASADPTLDKNATVEAALKSDLEKAIQKAWSSASSADSLGAALVSQFAKTKLDDLNVTQLQDFLERTPSLMTGKVK